MTRPAKSLHTAGALAGPIYVLLSILQILLREGFDPTRHAISQLSNGAHGWIQIANFFIASALVIAGAIGMRVTLRGSIGATWVPILLFVYGVGLFGAGIFAADVGRGFPPGAVAPPSITRSGVLHFVFGGLGFYALVGACLVFARRFRHQGQSGWAALSLLTGLGFLASFVAISSGPPRPPVMLAFYAAVAWVWAWHTAVHLKIQREKGAA